MPRPVRHGVLRSAERGEIRPEQLTALFDAGCSHRAMPDVMPGLTQKTMSDCVNDMAEILTTP